MSLKKCEECGKEVSDKADSCPNCGCPITKNVLCPYCNFDSGNTFKEIQKSGYSITCTNCGKIIKVMTNEEETLFDSQLREKQNIPKCPTCGSTKLSKVSTISKAGSVALWGLFSQKVKKTWHCGNCGYEW